MKTIGSYTYSICLRGHDMNLTRKRHPNGDTYCSACKIIKTKELKRLYPEKTKLYEKRAHIRMYGIEPEEYEKLLKNQEGVCKICSRFPIGRRLHIDHNHETGEVRGLICHHCNTALGLADESIERLKEMIKYLEAGLSRNYR